MAAEWPTEAMVEAGLDAMSEHDYGSRGPEPATVRHIYLAMEAARPARFPVILGDEVDVSAIRIWG